MQWEKQKLISGILLYKISLDCIYVQHISQIFEYSGFKIKIEYLSILLSYFLLSLFWPFFIKLHEKKFFSSKVLLLLLYLSFVPFTTMIGFYPLEGKFIKVSIIYWIFLLFIYFLSPSIRLKKIKNKKVTDTIIFFILLILSGTILFISGKYTNFRFKTNFNDIYLLRNEVEKFNVPILIGYLYSASKSINPLLMVYFLSRKKIKISIFIFFVQILSFSINGSKTILISTLLSIIFYIFYKNKYLKLLPWGFFLLNILSLLESYFFTSHVLTSYFIRRIFFVPNLLNYYYYDFFKSNSPDYLRQSFLRHLGQKSLYPPIDNMIGEIYFNKPNMGANNGLLSDAYANFGVMGIFIMPIFIVFILKILDSCSKELDENIFLIFAITLSFIFVSSFYFTILLTHGVLGLCITLYFLRSLKGINNE